MHSITKLSLVLLAGVGAFGCPKSPSGTTPTATATATAAATATATASAVEPAPTAKAMTAADLMPMCTEMAKRELECKDDMLPALVDLRITLDMPKGIAAKGKDKAGRDKLIAEAKKEIVVDHAPDKIQPLCEARMASMPGEMMAEGKAGGEKCNAEKDCKAFTACVMPMIEKMMPKGEAPPATK